MENQNNNLTEKRKADWHKVSKNGILVGKFLLLFFLLCLIITATLSLIDCPYSFFVVGLEISLGVIAAFTIVRMSTFKPVQSYDFERLKQEKEPIKLLLTNIDYDIGRYEEGSSYYFNGVRFYKYSTIILAGISTVVLGLDFGHNSDYVVFEKMNYTTLAKNIALVIGAIITVSTSLMTYWNIEKYWLINKSIVNKLRALKDDIENDFVVGKLINDENNLQEKIDEYKKIKGDFYKYWEGALADRGSQSEQSNTTNKG